MPLEKMMHSVKRNWTWTGVFYPVNAATKMVRFWLSQKWSALDCVRRRDNDLEDLMTGHWAGVAAPQAAGRVVEGYGLLRG